MSIKNYQPEGKVITPFNLQLSHYDMLCGEKDKQIKILRFVVVIACLSFFLSLGITFYAVNLPESIPVLVTMNDFGETSYVGAVSRKNFQNFNVPEIAVEYQVKKFIELYYTLSTDKVVMKSNLATVYHLLNTQSAQKLNILTKETNHYADFGDYTREVFFQTEPLKLSKDSYQVDFEVTKRTLSGETQDKFYYRCVLTVRMLKPTDDDIKFNPLGIYITNFDFKEIQQQKTGRK